MLLVILFVFLSLWDTTIARYEMILEEAYNCLPKSIILLNYTYTKATQKGIGYAEVLEKIEANSNTTISISIQRKNQENILLFINREINITKSDFCVELNSDIVFMPIIRQFMAMEKYCPINKGVYVFLRNKLYFKYTPTFPFGCWNIKFIIERNTKLLSCAHVTIQTRPSESNIKYQQCS